MHKDATLNTETQKFIDNTSSRYTTIIIIIININVNIIVFNIIVIFLLFKIIIFFEVVRTTAYLYRSTSLPALSSFSSSSRLAFSASKWHSFSHNNELKCNIVYYHHNSVSVLNLLNFCFCSFQTGLFS